MNLLEILDSTVQVDWEHEHRAHVTGFVVNDSRYQIQLQAAVVLPKNLGGLVIYEVSFLLLDRKGDSAFSSSGSSDTPLSVYGVVFNAILKKVHSLRCDGLMFSAEVRHSRDLQNHESKVRVYKFLAERFAKKTGWTLFESARNGSHEFLVMKEDLDLSGTDFVDVQEELRNESRNQDLPILRRS